MSPLTTIKVTVCQLRGDDGALEEDWQRLAGYVRETDSDLLLLPEMPFFAWPFWQKQFQADVWQAAVAAHDAWQERFSELGTAVVVGTRPATSGGQRLNRAFWRLPGEPGGAVQLGHSKVYLPDEPGFWEASWYARGVGDFRPEMLELAAGASVCAGFLICTELWFMHAARQYGQAGADLLLTPRATERRTVDKWLAGGRAAAVIAGAYSLSSNHYREGDGTRSLGGFGWVIGPDGEVLALTTPGAPFATVSIDLQRARQAKQTYPRYVSD